MFAFNFTMLFLKFSGDPSGRLLERNSLENKEIISNTNYIQNIIIKIFKNHQEIFWSKEKNFTGELPKLK